MKAKEVLETLDITRPTLSKYVKQGLIKVDAEVNGQYEYNDASVYAILGKGVHQETPEVKSEDLATIANALKDIYNILSTQEKAGHLPPASFPLMSHLRETIVGLLNKVSNNE